MLNRLEKAKLIRQCKPSGKTDGRNRKAYKITAAGKKELKRWLEEPSNRRSVRDENVLKIFSGSMLGPEGNLKQLDRLKMELVELQSELAGHDKALRASYSDSPDYQYWRLVLRAGQLSCEARLNWCKEAIKELEKLQRASDSLSRRKND